MICKVCKKWFRYEKKRYKFCSDNCARIATKQNSKKYRKNITKKQEIIKKCLICEKNFKTSKNYQKYCSRNCLKKTQDAKFVFENKDRLSCLNGKSISLLKLRIMVFDRDNFCCRYCGRSPLIDSNVKLHVDHKIPRISGGNDSFENLITSCLECNLGKSDYLLDLWNNKKNL